MSDREELDFEELEGARKEGRLPWFALGGVAALLILAGLPLYLGEGESPSPPPPPLPLSDETRVGGGPAGEPVAAPPPPAPLPPAPLVLPDLPESDGFVRGYAVSLTDRPFPPGWIDGDDLVRRFVAAVDNVAEGHSPRGHFPFLRVEGDFAVSRGPDSFLLDPRGYRRYDALAGTLSSLDPGKSADLYLSLLPLFREAYRDLGYPDRTFDDTFGRALYRLLGVPPVEGEIVLLKGERVYHFEDPGLENLSPAEKHLLRTGPANMVKIQEGLRRLASALEITPPPHRPGD